MLTIAGDLGLAGRRYHAEALLGEHETFVNLLGAWYGDRTKGLADATCKTRDKATAKADARQVETALRRVYDQSGEVLDATVTEGPDIDGELIYVAGADDRLPREIKVPLHLDKATMAALEAAA